VNPTYFIGLDGATFSILDGLMEDGTMPALSRLAADGVRADLLSTPNPLTPAAWTSMMTGCNPGRHGIYDFLHVTHADDGPPDCRIATSLNVGCETVWALASRQGRSVISLNFPLMFPPPQVNGFVVPGFVPPRHLRRFVHPPALYEKLRVLPGFQPRELLLDLDLERESIQTLPNERYEEWIRLHLRREEQWAAILRSLLAESPCDLTGVLFDGMDKLQHLCWRLIDPRLFPGAPSRWERTIRDLCLEYFRQVDGYIAEITAAAGPDGRFVIASDHGFGATEEVFYANVLLEKHGYLRWSAAAQPDTVGRQMFEGHRNPSVLFDWERTTAYALTAGSNGIYIRVAREPGTTGVPPDQYEFFRRRLIDVLLSCEDPSDGTRVVRRVMTREEAFPGSQSHRAPDLTLVLRDYGFLSILKSDTVLRKRPVVAGTHNPAGVFLAKGPGIRKAARLGPYSVSDVTPLLLYSLGLPIPEGLDGVLPVDAFEAWALRAEPPRTCGPVAVRASGSMELDSEVKDYIEETLRALGYLE
jgi:predicted AlkP superfamily phosphohydrolase/phosphomutase